MSDLGRQGIGPSRNACSRQCRRSHARAVYNHCDSIPLPFRLDMERRKVNSSLIRSAGYDPGSQILEVELTDGSIWQYSKVPGEVHRRFMAAPSMVSFYRDSIEDDYSRRRLK